MKYRCTQYPLERGGVPLHLERMTVEDRAPEGEILLVHGVTYSSHQFDLDYEDYSVARRLAREGYGVWLLDIAGFGRSGPVADGFLPDSDYAARDIAAAVETILRETGRERADLLGWSWGTVTASRFAAARPELVDRLVLYGPVLRGVGGAVTEPFHHNSWDHVTEEFPRGEDGAFDESFIDPMLLHVLCSSCWRWDGEYSPNGGRRDVSVPETRELIDLTRLRMPTLIICGDEDFYMDYGRIGHSLELLPEGSALEIIPGGSHDLLFERRNHREFQDRVVRFLKRRNHRPPCGGQNV